MDADIRNSFHQLRLALESSLKLSIQTPLGLLRPVMMPEGIKTGSQELMQRMHEVFQDFFDWAIVIFDNILGLAYDWEDCFHKLKLLIFIHLKLSKCKFGFREVEFFGYVIRGDTYGLSDARAKAVAAIRFPGPPQQQKKMQRFLGAALYFRPFIEDYAVKAAHLYEMTHNKFNWSEKT